MQMQNEIYFLKISKWENTFSMLFVVPVSIFYKNMHSQSRYDIWIWIKSGDVELSLFRILRCCKGEMPVNGIRTGLAHCNYFKNNESFYDVATYYSVLYLNMKS